jgi:uncharacterized membrane protein YdjX (TVP38/TMEM64 family)
MTRAKIARIVPGPIVLGLVLLGLIVLVAAVAAVGGIGGLSLPRGSEVIAAVAAFGSFGWIVFAGLQILVSVSGVLPASALGVAAGSIYGVVLGFVLSGVSSLAGAALAFGLSRSVLRPWIERRMRDRQHLQRIDAAIRRDGWRLACLVRLSPIMPFAATSYMLGLSAISFRDYCIGTLFSLPALFGYVVIGSLAGAGVQASTSGAGLIRMGLLGAGVLATGIVTVRIGQIVAAVMGWRSAEQEIEAADADTTQPSVSLS